MPEQKNTNNSGKKWKIILTICVVAIIILLGAVIFLLTNRKEDVLEESEKRNVVVNQENAEEIAIEMIEQEYIAPGYYNASMSTSWHFETGDAISEDAYVSNLAENTNDVYFDVFLEDQEDDPILESPVIPRGSELEDIALDRPLDVGTYDCVMVYHLIDEEQNTVSTLRVGLEIIVEN